MADDSDEKTRWVSADAIRTKRTADPGQSKPSGRGTHPTGHSGSAPNSSEPGDEGDGRTRPIKIEGPKPPGATVPVQAAARVEIGSDSHRDAELATRPVVAVAVGKTARRSSPGAGSASQPRASRWPLPIPILGAFSGLIGLALAFSGARSRPESAIGQAFFGAVSQEARSARTKILALEQEARRRHNSATLERALDATADLVRQFAKEPKWFREQVLGEQKSLADEYLFLARAFYTQSREGRAVAADYRRAIDLLAKVETFRTVSPELELLKKAASDYRIVVEKDLRTLLRARAETLVTTGAYSEAVGVYSEWAKIDPDFPAEAERDSLSRFLDAKTRVARTGPGEPTSPSLTTALEMLQGMPPHPAGARPFVKFERDVSETVASIRAKLKELVEPRLLVDGKTKLAQGQYDLARLAFTKLLAVPVGDFPTKYRADARYCLAQALFLAGQDIAAQAEIEELLKEAPNQMEAYLWRAHYLSLHAPDVGERSKSQIGAAMNAYRVAAKLEPDDARPWCRLAVLNACSGQEKEAQECRKKARAIAHSHPSLVNEHELSVLNTWTEESNR